MLHVMQLLLAKVQSVALLGPYRLSSAPPVLGGNLAQARVEPLGLQPTTAKDGKGDLTDSESGQQDCNRCLFPCSRRQGSSRSEISLQGTGLFTKDSAGQGTTEHTTNAGGFLLGYGDNLTRWLAAEAVYGDDRNTQHYFGTSGLARIQAQEDAI